MIVLTIILSISYILNGNFVSLLILYLFTGGIYLVTKKLLFSLLIAILLVSIFVSSGLLNFREGHTNKLCSDKCATRWDKCLTNKESDHTGSFDKCFANLLSGKNGFATDCSANCMLTTSMMKNAPPPWSPRSHETYNDYSGNWNNDGSGRNSIELRKVTKKTDDDDYDAWCILRGCGQLNSKAQNWCNAGGSNACKNQCGTTQGDCDPTGTYKPLIHNN